MLRSASRGMAVFTCILLLIGALTGSPVDPAPAYAGGSTGIPPPPDSTPGAYYPPGDDEVQTSSSSGSWLLYLITMSTLAM